MCCCVEDDADEPPPEAPCAENCAAWKRHAQRLIVREAHRRAVTVADVERQLAAPLRMTVGTLRSVVSPAHAAFSARALLAVDARLRRGSVRAPCTATELDDALARLTRLLDAL